MEELTLEQINMLATGKIKHKHDAKVILPPDCWSKKTVPIESHVKKNNNSYKIFGKPKSNETMEERAIRLANAYKKIDQNKGLDNDVTSNYIVEHIFTNKCLKCGETDWHKLGCDRIDNTKGHLINNIVCACYKCNISRNVKPFEDFYNNTL